MVVLSKSEICLALSSKQNFPRAKISHATAWSFLARRNLALRYAHFPSAKIAHATAPRCFFPPTQLDLCQVPVEISSPVTSLWRPRPDSESPVCGDLARTASHQSVATSPGQRVNSLWRPRQDSESTVGGTEDTGKQLPASCGQQGGGSHGPG